MVQMPAVNRAESSAGAAGVFFGDDGAADHALGGVIVQADHREVTVRGQAVPCADHTRTPCGARKLDAAS